MDPLKAKLRTRRFDSRGSSTGFIKINEEIGVKLYKSRRQRDLNYAAQRFLFARDIMPAAFHKFEITRRNRTNGKRKVIFCFLTEVVEVGKIVKHYEWNEFQDRVNKLVNCRISDGMGDNVGLKNGKVYLLDCSICKVNGVELEDEHVYDHETDSRWYDYGFC